MWSNDATVGIEARGDPRTPTIAHRPPKLKVLKRRPSTTKIPREDSVNLNAHTVNTALSAQHRSLSSTLSEALRVRAPRAPDSPALPARRERARGGPTSARTAFRRTPFPPTFTSFDEFLFPYAFASRVKRWDGSITRDKKQGWASCWARVRGLHTRSKIA